MDHPAFSNAGAHKGIELWRIENFEPVPVPTGEIGKFYTGDSYIILNTKEDNRKRLSYDLHFWLGSKTSIDESGTAAILTVALDDKLGGAPVQHREVQGHESPVFLGYFKPAIRYMDGGHSTGFNHVTTNAGAEKRMFQVKGNKNIRVKQVGPGVSSMNTGDCFILNIDHDIYVYVGPKARRVEKLKAVSVANQIRDQDHNGRAKIDIIDDYSSDRDFDKFFEALGSGSKNTVPEDSAGGDDETFETSEQQIVSLYRITDESGKMEAIPVSQKPFRQDQLNENDCFVLDTVTGGIYVWVGKQCNQKERAEVMSRAQNYIETKNYPSWVHVTRVPQGTEPAAFKQYFSTWKDHGASHTRLIRSISDEEMYSSDAEVADARIKKVVKSGAARGFMPDKGDGHTIVYRVQGDDLIEVADSADPERSADDGSKYGQFYQGDSYVIKYEYTNSQGDTAYVICYWIGKDSTPDEQENSYALAKVMNEDLGGDHIVIKVPQGSEPKHFLKLFNGKMITLLGGHGSEFKYFNTKDSYDTDGTRLFKIQGNEMDSDMRVEQIPEDASNIDHEDVFLLETPDNIYAWIGKESSDEERQAATFFSKVLFGEDKEPITINEDEESEDFWNALGGAPEEVRRSSILKQRTRLRVGQEPHLLQVNIRKNGRVRLQDIGGYQQEDLDSDSVYILDSGEEIYVWIGSEASNVEKDSVQSSFSEYLKDDPADRTVDNALVIIIKQSREPDVFKRMFEDWDDDMWTNQLSYDDVKNKVIQTNEIL
ncbi:gelsolin isoform X2 [Arctopsyche grandis]